MACAPVNRMKNLEVRRCITSKPFVEMIIGMSHLLPLVDVIAGQPFLAILMVVRPKPRKVTPGSPVEDLVAKPCRIRGKLIWKVKPKGRLPFSCPQTPQRRKVWEFLLIIIVSFHFSFSYWKQRLMFVEPTSCKSRPSTKRKIFVLSH